MVKINDIRLRVQERIKTPTAVRMRVCAHVMEALPISGVGDAGSASDRRPAPDPVAGPGVRGEAAAQRNAQVIAFNIQTREMHPKACSERR